MPPFLRIRLNFQNFQNGIEKNCWFVFDKGECKSVLDFHSLIQRRFALGINEMKCLVKGYFLPKGESIEVIRDEDEITIESDRACLQLSNVLGNETLLSIGTKELIVSKDSKRKRKSHKQPKVLQDSTGMDPQTVIVEGTSELVFEEESMPKRRKCHKSATVNESEVIKDKKSKSNLKSKKKTLKVTKPEEISEKKKDKKVSCNVELVEKKKGDNEKKDKIKAKPEKSEDSLAVKPDKVKEKVVKKEVSNHEDISCKEKKVKKDKKARKKRESHIKKEKDDNHKISIKLDNSSKSSDKKCTGYRQRVVQTNEDAGLSGVKSEVKPNEKIKVGIETNTKEKPFEILSKSFTAASDSTPSSKVKVSSRSVPRHKRDGSHVYFSSDEEDVDMSNHETKTSQNSEQLNPASSLSRNEAFNEDVESVLKILSYRASNNISLNLNQPVLQQKNIKQINEDPSLKTSMEVEPKINENTKIVRDYSTCKPLQGPPRTSDKIAYKILELSLSYTPELSEFKEAEVTSFDSSSNLATLLLSNSSLQKIVGDGTLSRKFELLSEDEIETCEQSNIVEVNWQDMVEPVLL